MHTILILLGGGYSQIIGGDISPIPGFGTPGAGFAVAGKVSLMGVEDGCEQRHHVGLTNLQSYPSSKGRVPIVSQQARLRSAQPMSYYGLSTY